MRLEMIAEAALPVGFAVAEPWGYVAKGTCFLVSFGGRFWVVTAAHVLKRQGFSAEEVRVPARMDSMEMIRLDQVIEHVSRDADDTDVADVMILRVASGTPGYAIAPRIALDDINTATEWTVGDELRVFGYSTSLENVVNHDDRTVQRERYLAGATYVRKSSAAYVHEIEFEKVPRVETIDGMSGAPIFSRVAGAENWSFAGMLLRGTHDTTRSRSAYFLEGKVIVGDLAKAAAAP